MPRLGALVIALVAWTGLAVQFAATFTQTGSALETVWILLRFFTVITNLLVALSMTWIAAGNRVTAPWLGGITLAILLVGIVYFTLLRGLVELSGGALLADALLHKAVPTLVALYWPFAPRGGLRWAHPLLWALYPLAYFAYALVRGGIEGRYPYPFMDVGRLGMAQTLTNSFLIAVAFIIGGALLVALDRALAARANARSLPTS